MTLEQYRFKLCRSIYTLIVFNTCTLSVFGCKAPHSTGGVDRNVKGKMYIVAHDGIKPVTLLLLAPHSEFKWPLSGPERNIRIWEEQRSGQLRERSWETLPLQSAPISAWTWPTCSQVSTLPGTNREASSPSVWSLFSVGSYNPPIFFSIFLIFIASEPNWPILYMVGF